MLQNFIPPVNILDRAPGHIKRMLHERAALFIFGST